MEVADQNRSHEVVRTIKFIDLFCGLGAFHHAFDAVTAASTLTKFECVFACDIDDKVRQIYEDNYHIRPSGDINAIDVEQIPDFDILCGGFPCQPFSIAGKKEGFDDKEKGNLFFSILRIVDAKKPSTIMLENVKNLLTINGGETFATIKSELEKRGYEVAHKVIDSKYCSPQSRQRLYIVCQRGSKYVFPTEPANKSSMVKSVSTILDPTETRFMNYMPKYRLEPTATAAETAAAETTTTAAAAETAKTAKTAKTATTATTPTATVRKTASCRMLYRMVNNTTNKGGRQGERVYSVDACGPTICASSGGPGAKTGLYYINGRVRRLNVLEGLRMFGFDDGYKWDRVREEEMLFYLGNSIVVNVLRSLIGNLNHNSLTLALEAKVQKV
jgi:DNA (cytosine-5)-methyltransferase 1